MAAFREYEDGYETNWAKLEIRPERVPEVQRQAQRLMQGKSTYLKVEARTGVPWWFVGLCHYRESSFNFETYLGNGQPLGMVTTKVPKGRGPFTGPNAFLDGAIDALRLVGFVGATDWGIARVLYRLEGFNGYGYHRRGVNSPYLYGGSTCYGPPQRAGKFVADHVFDPAVVDTQLGTAVILKALMALDQTITFGVAPQPTPGLAPQPDDELAGSVLWLQQSLNRLAGNTQLAEDGKNGPRTMAAVSQFQQDHGLPDTGIADAATIAAIQRALTAPPAAAAIDVLTQRVTQLEHRIGASNASAVSVQGAPLAPAASDANELTALLERALAIAERTQPAGTATSGPAVTRSADRLPTATTFPTGTLAPGQGSPALGQVNGALGATLGDLLNGKKTAIGMIGALLTSLLSQVPGDTGLGQVLTMLTPASGLSQFGMPIFLTMTAWGVLGKFEKWAQGTVPPAQLAK
jgi:lysozyme family protein/peptidoglycan hydrolase-like protein with peptidoglycan-binding domain